MLKKRIIPCLDIKDGQTVKGVNFVDLQYAGNPVELAQKYVDEGADELVFLDITATVENRKTLVKLVQRLSEVINIPFTVGGGIYSVEQVSELLQSGADKISVNSSAIKNPDLINEIANNFGSQCVVVAIDTNKVDNEWLVYTHGGRKATTIKTFDWVVEVEKRGAGEILLTSMVNDGTKQGFAVELTRKVNQLVNIPVIASGGAGNAEHFNELFKNDAADAALAASIFHYGEVKIPTLKKVLKEQNIAIRL